VIDLSMTGNGRARPAGTDPTGVIPALIQLTTAVLAQVLLELAALHAVIR
jgi:hypothetical protein